jgi:deazaflavin-dependent oxidoreductase (nitroreductase family)
LAQAHHTWLNRVVLNLPAPNPNSFQRLILRLASARPVAWVLARLLPSIDHICLRLTGGRHTATSLLSGLPVLILTTRGARSGLPRQHLLLSVKDGERILLFPTNFGSEKAPAWLYNLRANPQAELGYRGQQAEFLAHEASGEELLRSWAMADALYPGYAAYRRRIHQRRVPVIVLEPVAAPETSQQRSQ